jgi:hypothetical protein
MEKFKDVLRLEIMPWKDADDRLPAVRAIRVANAPSAWEQGEREQMGEALYEFLVAAENCDDKLKSPSKLKLLSKKHERDSDKTLLEIPEKDVSVLAKFEFGQKINGEPSSKFLHEGNHKALQKNARDLKEVVKKALNEWFFFLLPFYPSVILPFLSSFLPFFLPPCR